MDKNNIRNIYVNCNTSHGRRKRRLRIYLASPIGTYASKRYDRMATMAAGHFPDAMIVPARGLYRDTPEWRARWPNKASQYDALAFFADELGFIGIGVAREIADIEALGRPVHWLNDTGDLLDPRAFVFRKQFDRWSDPTRFALVRPRKLSSRVNSTGVGQLLAEYAVMPGRPIRVAPGGNPEHAINARIDALTRLAAEERASGLDLIAEEAETEVLRLTGMLREERERVLQAVQARAESQAGGRIERDLDKIAAEVAGRAERQEPSHGT